jgi:hypothetical protein
MAGVPGWKFEAKGLQETVRAVGTLQKNVDRGASKALTKIGAYVVRRSRLNAPILYGPLRENIKREPTTKIAGIVATGVTASVPYALFTHEGLYNLGPISSIQPGTMEGGVGRKYIERVVLFHREKFEQWFAAAMTEAVQLSSQGREVSEPELSVEPYDGDTQEADEA